MAKLLYWHVCIIFRLTLHSQSGSTFLTALWATRPGHTTGRTHMAGGATHPSGPTITQLCSLEPLSYTSM